MAVALSPGACQTKLTECTGLPKFSGVIKLQQRKITTKMNKHIYFRNVTDRLHMLVREKQTTVLVLRVKCYMPTLRYLFSVCRQTSC